MGPFLALIRKDPDTDYSVEFPDFPGCVTAGVTLSEAVAMAHEALELHAAGMVEDGDAIPETQAADIDRQLGTVSADLTSGRAFAVMIPVADPEDLTSRDIRVAITVPEPDLQAIDAYAEERGMTRSSFLVDAARRAMRDRAA